MYVKCSEDNERKKRKSPFSTTTLSSDAPSPGNPREYLHKPYTAKKLRSLGYIFVSDSIWVALQIFEQFCPKAGDANPLVAEPETDFNGKWPFKVIQGRLFQFHWRVTKGLQSIINVALNMKVQKI